LEGLLAAIVSTFRRPAMTEKDDSLSVLEKNDFCEYKEEQIVNGNEFDYRDQLQYCHDNYNEKQPSSSQLSRVWLAREEWQI
jgi:hypothetical protein